MVSGYNQSFSRWRLISLLLILLMGAFIGFCVHWVSYNQDVAGNFLSSFDSLITLCSLLFIPAIDYSFKQEINQSIESEKKKLSDGDKEITVLPDRR